MKEQRIVIEIDRNGGITADAEGFVGGTCIAELERLLDGLSPLPATVERKPDEKTATVVRKQTVGKKS